MNNILLVNEELVDDSITLRRARVYRHEILAHISNPLRQRPAMYDFVFLAYLVAIPRHSLNF